MNKFANALLKFDRIVLVLFGVGLLVGGYFALLTYGPEWKARYQKAAAEAVHEAARTESKDPQGMVMVACIRNGKFEYVRMTREERDRLIRAQSRR